MPKADSITAAAPAPAPARTSGRTTVKRERVSIDDGDASRQSTPASASASAKGPELKKRKTAPGSRGVANLTPEQLEKKRANDREAQRAIRERTRLTIAHLESRIQELTSQQPYQELQAALRAKEAVEAENADIKRRLATVMAMLQPMVSSPNQSFMPMPGTATSSGPQSTTAHNISSPSSPDHDSPPTTADPYSTNSQWNSPAPPQGQVYRKRLDQQRHELAHGLEMGSERLELGFLLDQPKHADGPIAVVSHEPSDYHIQHAVPFPSTVSYPLSSSIDPALQHVIDPALSGHHPDSTTPIKNCQPTCPLDSLLLEFLKERKQRQAEGFSNPDVLGPRYPSVSSLLNPLREAHPLSKVFIDILQTFPNISRLPEKIAVLYVMFLVMRWQIDPSPDNYDRLPSFVRPLPSQLHSAHPAWVDLVPFPAMRERLIRDYAPPDVFPFENFFIPFTSTLSINWPYDETDPFLQGPESDELMINPVFERHLRRPENWTLGDAFARALPMLDGTYNLKTENVGKSQMAGSSGTDGKAAGSARNGQRR